jgi:hypothetical protein
MLTCRAQREFTSIPVPRLHQHRPGHSPTTRLLPATPRCSTCARSVLAVSYNDLGSDSFLALASVLGLDSPLREVYARGCRLMDDKCDGGERGAEGGALASNTLQRVLSDAKLVQVLDLRDPLHGQGWVWDVSLSPPLQLQEPLSPLGQEPTSPLGPPRAIPVRVPMVALASGEAAGERSQGRSPKGKFPHGTDVSKRERAYGGGGEAAGERSQGRSPKQNWQDGTDASEAGECSDEVAVDETGWVEDGKGGRGCGVCSVDDEHVDASESSFKVEAKAVAGAWARGETRSERDGERAGRSLHGSAVADRSETDRQTQPDGQRKTSSMPKHVAASIQRVETLLGIETRSRTAFPPPARWGYVGTEGTSGRGPARGIPAGQASSGSGLGPGSRSGSGLGRRRSVEGMLDAFVDASSVRRPLRYYTTVDALILDHTTAMHVGVGGEKVEEWGEGGWGDRVEQIVGACKELHRRWMRAEHELLQERVSRWSERSARPGGGAGDGGDRAAQMDDGLLLYLEDTIRRLSDKVSCTSMSMSVAVAVAFVGGCACVCGCLVSIRVDVCVWLRLLVPGRSRPSNQAPTTRCNQPQASHPSIQPKPIPLLHQPTTTHRPLPFRSSNWRHRHSHGPPTTLTPSQPR